MTARAFDAGVSTVAMCLAFKGFLAEHPEAGEAEAHSWAVANGWRYIDDAAEFLEAKGRQLAAEQTAGLPARCSGDFA